MLTVPYYKQESDYLCGPASLQMAFAFFNHQISQTEIAQAASTTEEKGTSHAMMVKVAQAAGFTTHVKEPADLANIQTYLKQNIPVIVNFIEPTDEEGHYAVVVDMNDNYIILNDPWNGPNFKLAKEDFLHRWHSQTSQHIRWLMAITKFTPEPQ